tara:strand:+ start:47779 stop:48087 length:309 start_codon:yes stop_codon:yes gene_type:complete
MIMIVIMLFLAWAFISHYQDEKKYKLRQKVTETWLKNMDAKSFSFPHILNSKQEVVATVKREDSTSLGKRIHRFEFVHAVTPIPTDARVGYAIDYLKAEVPS